jgi:hypothetical protein
MVSLPETLIFNHITLFRFAVMHPFYRTPHPQMLVCRAFSSMITCELLHLLAALRTNFICVTLTSCNVLHWPVVLSVNSFHSMHLGTVYFWGRRNSHHFSQSYHHGKTISRRRSIQETELRYDKIIYMQFYALGGKVTNSLVTSVV